MVESLPRLAAPLIALAIVATGCAHVRRDAPAPVTSAPAPFVETGKASWYGKPHHGKATASGERFDMYALTAAHRTLPLGSHVRVTNLANGRMVNVRINDRGPTLEDRIIDLSYAAARALGAIGDGVFPVRIAVVE